MGVGRKSLLEHIKKNTIYSCLSKTERKLQNHTYHKHTWNLQKYSGRELHTHGNAVVRKCIWTKRRSRKSRLCNDKPCDI